MLALAVVHGAALLVLLPLPVSWWIKLPVAVVVLFQGWLAWRKHVRLMQPDSVRRLVWLPDDRWELLTADGAVREARLLPASYVHPWLAVLRFVAEDRRRYTVLLPSDALDPDSHRKLRVRLGLYSDEKLERSLV